MIPQIRKYFILIVHYGNVATTNTLVTTLLASAASPEKIIVVDHADVPTKFSFSSSKVQIIRPEENSGYAGGVNIGLGILLAEKIVRDDIVVCCNNDVQITPETLSQLSQWWQDNPEPALAGVKGGHVNLCTGRATLNPDYSLLPTHYLLPYIHGAFFCAPYRVLMRLTGLPTHYFLYWEDVLLSQRAMATGIPLRLLTAVEVSHADQPKANYTEQQMYYLVRNGALFLQQETSPPWRVWWWLLNKFRWVFHRGIVRRALRDAAWGRTGRIF